MMALYAANNIARALNRFGQRGKVRLGGLICNQRNAFMEREAVESLAHSLGTKVSYFVPRDNVVQECEMQGKTVIEGAPESAQANVYREVAHTILTNEDYSIPTPLTDDEFEELLVRVKAEGLAA
jgi:nitrogenase iron protein NifH